MRLIDRQAAVPVTQVVLAEARHDARCVQPSEAVLESRQQLVLAQHLSDRRGHLIGPLVELSLMVCQRVRQMNEVVSDLVDERGRGHLGLVDELRIEK